MTSSQFVRQEQKQARSVPVSCAATVQTTLAYTDFHCLRCTILHCTALHCDALRCIAMHWRFTFRNTTEQASFPIELSALQRGTSLFSPSSLISSNGNAVTLRLPTSLIVTLQHVCLKSLSTAGRSCGSYFAPPSLILSGIDMNTRAQTPLLAL
jgi:hypothetical protein